MTENRHYKALELDKILTMLAEQTGCEDSRRLALETEPKTTLREARRLMDSTADAHMLACRFGAPSLRGVKNITGALRRAEMGATLSLPELLDIERFLKALREMKDFRSNYEGERATALDELFDSLMPNLRIEEKIGFTVVSEEEVSDTASPTLADIRRKIRNSQAKVKEQLDRIIHSATYQKFLQEPIVTMRDGRYCVPVKSEYRQEIKGMVHDTSGTGATVFIEPASVVEENNETRVLRAKEQQEIQRILHEISEDIGSHAQVFIEDYASLVELDLYFAKARLADKMNAAVPRLTDDGKIILHKARHPLIDKTKIVPVDITLGCDFDVLVITGPNTGGKTVTLKTIGLLTLMAMCGMMIPAGENSSVSVFESVFADIGDEQSIEQNLSTFSAHMTNIVHILAECGESSLLLFDELGAGTDPTEGAALAIAVIENARQRGATIAATTHYAELKVYATSESGIQNASCEFDVETLRPTYRLLVGIPGKSNAFAISRRLGLDDAIIEDAKRRVGVQNADFEATIEKLEKTRLLLERDRAEAAKKLREAEENAKKAAFLRAELAVRLEKADEKSRREAERIIEDARRTAEETFAELDEMRRHANEQEEAQRVNEARSELRRKLNEHEGKLKTAKPEPPREEKKSARNAEVGDTVEILSMGVKAEVVGVNSDGSLELKAGIMNVKAKQSEVCLVEGKAEKKKVSYNIQSSTVRSTVSSEIDLRGMESIEAVNAAEMYIDNAVMAKLSTVTIIHGKGTGALRAAIHQMLKRNKAVKSFRLGRYGEGETGVTIVELK